MPDGVVVVAEVNHLNAPTLFKRMRLESEPEESSSRGQVLYWYDRMAYHYRGQTNRAQSCNLVVVSHIAKKHKVAIFKEIYLCS